MFSCHPKTNENEKTKTKETNKIHTAYSTAKNEYLNFNSVAAINKVAAIENEYFRDRKHGVSKYYGTQWREMSENIVLDSNISQYDDYLNRLSRATGAQANSQKPDSLHCTLYAFEALKAGLNADQLTKLDSLHKTIWKEREIAGWSIGYLLVKHFGWEAYLMISTYSNEYDQCLKHYVKHKSYPVWKQPDIPLKKMFTIGEEDSLINSLLVQNEFSWGFSYQGYHTWITRYTELKECIWSGAPSARYDDFGYDNPLFVATNFYDYYDYNSHVIVVPPKLNIAETNVIEHPIINDN
jgi:hypothetical protein